MTLLTSWISSELSLWLADKVVDFWCMRIMPAARIRPNSQKRSSSDMRLGQMPFCTGWFWGMATFR